MALNADGVLIWLVCQYATQFATGVAPHPAVFTNDLLMTIMTLTNTTVFFQ